MFIRGYSLRGNIVPQYLRSFSKPAFVSCQLIYPIHSQAVSIEAHFISPSCRHRKPKNKSLKPMMLVFSIATRSMS